MTQRMKMLVARKQSGMSIIGLIFLLGLIAVVVLIGAKITPTAMEFLAVKRAIITAKASGNSVADIQKSFDKQAEVAYITSIKGNDLIIEKEETGYEVSFYYTKKIPLAGPASLLLEYEGTTQKTKFKTKKID
ncbi:MULTISPECIES: DUF4845 domain-containing protein [Undibacterium]|nr:MULTISPECIES: DUF4845 domain-containing protein [Undibacterium]